ncbi:hypothetical protein [Polyangium jinanense]|uniref:Uncharacterized protein n=1 Tax=Polyangium jinanense TaxID=2829994 RepID=A0A9X3X9F8_9BACT|nr:hypothetical protein [Polyangium jinanense]MDC3961166.1 hypothetical protein [Polyangium jinanense]MDC3986469.1 hypothetical protein [Polyangium jinanense]
MIKRWNVVGIIFGSLAAMVIGCDADDPAGEGALGSTSDEVGEAWGTPIASDPFTPRTGCRGFHCASELPPGRCSYGRDCAVSCVFPAGGCEPGNDASCLGYCLADAQCIPDPTCGGGQRCLECGGSTYGAGCIEVCAPIAPPPPPPPPLPPQQGPVQQPPQQGPVQQPPQQGPVQQEPLPPPPPPPPKDDCPLDTLPPPPPPPAQLPY